MMITQTRLNFTFMRTLSFFCTFFMESQNSKWFWLGNAINITVRKDFVYGFEFLQTQRYIPVIRCKGKNGLYWIGPTRKSYFWLLEHWRTKSSHIHVHGQLCGIDV